MHKKKLTFVGVAFAALLNLMLLPGGAWSAAPQKLSVSAAGQARQNKTDANYQPLVPAWSGFKVFIVAPTGSCQQLTDETGATVVKGVVDHVILSSGTGAEFLLLADSNTTSGVTTASTSLEIAPPLFTSSATGANNGQSTYYQINAQFNTGVVGCLSKPLNGGAVIYFTPDGGKN